MASPYGRINGDDDDDDEDMIQLTQTEIVFQQMRARGRHWPRVIGVVEIVVGFILTILGVLEVFILPMMESKDDKNLILFDESNCYGAGMFAGLVMVLTGSTAIRASISKRNTSVYRFFNLTIFSLLLYGALTIFLIVAYAKGWTGPEKYEPGSHVREVHIFVTICTVMGLLFALTAFVQYFDVICCGEYPLWVTWAKFFFCCCYGQGRTMFFEELVREDLGNRNDPI